MNEEDIDGERGIIVEEWRTGQGYSQRMLDQYLPILLHNSRYANRLPIGKMEIVENFEYETIRRFYRDWYRPNNMAVIAVGDEDPDQLEALIKEFFSDLVNPTDAPERISFEVPEHAETFVSIVTDEEAPGIQLQLFYKHQPLASHTALDYKKFLMRIMYAGMLSQRLDEIRQNVDAPFIFAGTSYGKFVRSLDYFTANAVVPPGKALVGIQSLIEENERVAKHGFTQAELDRVKRSLLNSAERAFNEMDKVESRGIVGRYVNNFLEGRFAEGEAWKYDFYQKVMPQITLAEINDLAKELVRDDNRVIVLLAPTSQLETLPSEEDVLAIFDRVAQMELTPYQEELLRDQLLSALPNPGSIVEQKSYEPVDIQEFVLSNGARVFVKSTDFKNDEILFSISGNGGVSLFGDEDHYSASYAGVMVNIMGVGDFSPTDLRKILAGKTVSVTPNVGTYSQTITGATNPKDLETALQLIHMYFTSPRKDPELFQIYVDNQKSQLKSAQANPDFQFSVALNKLVANNNLRALSIYDPDDLDKVSVERGLEIYRDRFGNAANFEFYFTGNIDVDTFLPMVELYLASLPGDLSQVDGFNDLGIRPPKGVSETIRVGTDEKGQVILFFTDEKPYDRALATDVSFLGELLTIKLIENLREELGGVYGVGASGSMTNQPVGQLSFSISFPCSPDMVEKLTDAAWAEVKKIQEKGPTPEDLEKVKEKRRIAYQENLKRNNYWNAQMATARQYDFPFDNLLEAGASIEAVSIERIQRIAQHLLTKENLLEIVKLPLVK